MRLVELLMVLIVEGRKALPKTPHPSLMAKRLESVGGDRSHRQVIEAIRAGNNEEFYESMDSGKLRSWRTKECFELEKKWSCCSTIMHHFVALFSSATIIQKCFLQ